MKKDGEYICDIFLGDTSVEIRGYDRQVEYAYIGDENITEMVHGFNGWDKVVEKALEAQPWELAV